MSQKVNNVKPTNATGVLDRKGAPNRDNDVLLYILIVVSASILLLLIPLVNYSVQCCKRKSRRRRRRAQAEKAHARRMAERDILEKMMHESQKDGANRPTFVISNVTEVLEIPPRSPIVHSPSSTGSSESHRSSPFHMQKTSSEEKMMTTQYGLSGFVSERGLINKGYHSSNTVLSFPMRKATSDTFLPRDPTLMQNARRRYSEDLVEKEEPSAFHERRPLPLTKKNSKRTKDSGAKELGIQKKLEQEDQNGGEKTRKTSDQVSSEENERKVSSSMQKHSDETATRRESETSTKSNHLVDGKISPLDLECKDDEKSDSHASESEGYYDDIINDTYKNVDENDTLNNEDDPIYDVVDSPYCSDQEHIYSNVDELSETESHIYWNVDSLYENSREPNSEESEGDDYENLDFLYRNCDDDESDTSSVSYENLDFLDSNENKEEKVTLEEENEPPLIIPRRIPIPYEKNKKEDMNLTNDKIPATA